MNKRSGSTVKRIPSNSQLYVGMDMHKKTIQAAVISKNKILKNENISHTPPSFKEFLESFPKNTKFVIESSSVWHSTFESWGDM